MQVRRINMDKSNIVATHAESKKKKVLRKRE